MIYLDTTKFNNLVFHDYNKSMICSSQYNKVSFDNPAAQTDNRTTTITTK